MSAALAASRIAAEPLLERLAKELDPEHQRVVVHCDSGLTLAEDQAQPLVRAAWEAIANAMRHAYPLGSDGKVWVRLHGQGRLTLSVRDMGRGVPHFEDRPHPGIDAIKSCAHDLGGFARVDNRNYGGAEVTVVFPER